MRKRLINPRTFPKEIYYRVLLVKDTQTSTFNLSVTLQLPGSLSGWFKANVGQTGFYRVNYDEENWKRLSQQLRHNHTVSRCLMDFIKTHTQEKLEEVPNDKKINDITSINNFRF